MGGPIYFEHSDGRREPLPMDLHTAMADYGVEVARSEAARLERDIEQAMHLTDPDRWGHLVVVEPVGVRRYRSVASTWPEPLAPTIVEP